MKNIEDYSDIIDLPYRPSKNHTPMDRLNRAAQFAPFAALTGFGEAINETGRLVDEKIELSASEVEELNEKLRFLGENLEKNQRVSLVYFVPDERKNGGEYRFFGGTLKKIREVEGELVFDGGTVINVSDILKLSSPELDALDDLTGNSFEEETGE